MAFWSWSKTAATNSSADVTINWAEGQAPSSVNDSARAMMARTAEYRDDIAGAIATGGTSTAYTVTSYEVFDTLAHMANQMVAFTPHTTNAATVTLNVDGLGAKPLRTSPSVELQAGMLIQGTPYVATYNNSDAVWYLHNFYGNPYNIPLGGAMVYTGTTAPNSSFVFPFGQALSRTTYANYYAQVGTTFGIGDGSTTFNGPDFRSYAIIAADNMGGSGPGRTTLAFAATTGAQSFTIARNQLPDVTLSYSNSISVTSNAGNVVTGTVVAASNGGGAALGALASTGAAQSAIVSTGTSSGNTSSINGGVTQQTVSNMQPTLALNYILRII